MPGTDQAKLDRADLSVIAPGFNEEGNVAVLVSRLLVAPDDRDALADAIRSVLGDHGLAGRLGEGARRTVVDHYSIQRTANAWLTAYGEVA